MNNCIDQIPKDWKQKKHEKFVDEVSNKTTIVIFHDQ
jgi:hypothetical protein